MLPLGIMPLLYCSQLLGTGNSVHSHPHQHHCTTSHVCQTHARRTSVRNAVDRIHHTQHADGAPGVSTPHICAPSCTRREGCWEGVRIFGTGMSFKVKGGLRGRKWYVGLRRGPLLPQEMPLAFLWLHLSEAQVLKSESGSNRDLSKAESDSLEVCKAVPGLRRDAVCCGALWSTQCKREATGPLSYLHWDWGAQQYEEGVPAEDTGNAETTAA